MTWLGLSADGLRAKSFPDGLAAWLRQFHGADFEIADDGDTVTLTDGGAQKYQANSMQQAPAEGEGCAAPVSEEVKAQRNAVFGELAAAAARRPGARGEDE